MHVEGIIVGKWKLYCSLAMHNFSLGLVRETLALQSVHLGVFLLIISQVHLRLRWATNLGGWDCVYAYCVCRF